MSKMSAVKGTFNRFSLFVMFFIVFVIAIAMTGLKFLRPENLIVILAGASVMGLMSLGQGLVIIGGGFDLSIGSTATVVMALVALLKSQIGVAPACVVAVVAGTAIGLVSGLLVANTRIPPFIVTLGTSSIAKSIAWIVISGMLLIQVKELKDAIQPLVAWLPMGSNVFPIVVFILILVCTWLLLHKSKVGRYLYAVGANEAVAVASGVPVRWTKVFVYALSGFLCGIAAIVFLYRNVSASPGQGPAFLQETFAATMIGGVYMYGGEGTVLGILVGILTMAIITSVLTVAGVPPAAHPAVLGAIVLGVVLLQRWLKQQA